MLLPFASRPGEGNALSPSPGPAAVLTVPPPVRALRPEELKKGPAIPSQPPAKQRRGGAKDTPRPAPVCRTVQNLPLDHASMVRLAYEDPAPPSPAHKGRARGRPRTSSFSAPSPAHPTLPEEEEDEEDREQRLRLREQLGASSLLQLASASASTPDLSVLADVAFTLEPGDAGAADSEETETSDEAEEHKLEEDDDFLFSPRRTLAPSAMHPEGLLVLTEHNYFRSPAPLPSPAPASQRKGSSAKQEPAMLLPSDLNHHAISGVLEAPEEVIGDATMTDLYGPLGLLCEAGDVTETQAKATRLAPPGPGAKRRGFSAAREAELEAVLPGKTKKRRRKDSEDLELVLPKKQKEKETKKQKKRKLEVCHLVCCMFVLFTVLAGPLWIASSISSGKL